MTKKEKIEIRISKHSKIKFQEYCGKNNMTPSEIITELIRLCYIGKIRIINGKPLMLSKRMEKLTDKEIEEHINKAIEIN